MNDDFRQLHNLIHLSFFILSSNRRELSFRPDRICYLMEAMEAQPATSNAHSEGVKRRVAYFYDAEIGNYHYGQGHPMKVN
jgi:hypothetical protein